MKRVRRILVTLFSIVMLCTGCSGFSSKVEQPFSDYYDKMMASSEEQQPEGMAKDLAVLPLEQVTDPNYQQNVYGALSVNVSKKEVLESYHGMSRLYPASMTKVMTALLTLENADFSDTVTLTHDSVFDEGNVVRSTLSKGDQVTVESLFNALLVASDNDCAVILAEYIGGSVENFADMMNKRAKELGATGTHFVNPNGLHNVNHYTTPYDLYLIFNEVRKYDRFLNTVNQKTYTFEYTNENGVRVAEYLTNTNAYFSNIYPIPNGVTVIGGKTGTTSVAKYCLILLTKNQNQEDMISVIMGAQSKDILYHAMSELITK